MLHKNEKPKTSGNCLCFRSLFIFNCQKQSLRTLDLAGAQASGANVHMTRSSLHNRFYTLYVRLPCSVRPSVGVRNLDTERDTLATARTFGHNCLHLLFNSFNSIAYTARKCKCFERKKLIFFIILRLYLIQALNIVFSVPTGLVLPPFLRYNRLSF